MMHATSLHPVFIVLFMTFILMDAANVMTTIHVNTRNHSSFRKISRLFSQCFRSNKQQTMECLHQETAKNPLFSDWADPAQLVTTKSLLLESDAAHFHDMLALGKRGIALPREIGINVYLSLARLMCYTFAVVDNILGYFQPEEAPRWDSQFRGELLTLGHNNRSVFKERTEVFDGVYSYYNCVQSAQPCSRYSVKVVMGKKILIGFAPRDGYKFDRLSTRGWFISVADGDLIAHGRYLLVKKKKPKYGTPIPNGSVVTVIHDRRQRHIEFQVDGKSLGIAFTNVTQDELYAAIDVYGYSMAEIHIVDNS
jgi:hypothetical protein